MENYLVKIREIIKKKGLQQKYIAHRVGESPSNFSQILRGRQRMTVDLLLNLLKVLEIGCDELLGVKSKAGRSKRDEQLIDLWNKADEKTKQVVEQILETYTQK